MDEDVSRWILEFLLRQPIPDDVIRKALSSLPLPNQDSRFKKTLLLRSIQDQIKAGSRLSETILENLELVEELDRLDGVPVPDSMRVAYCAVAVCCTLEYVGDGEDMEGKYFSAMKRIWRRKVGKMEGKCGLFSDELAKWRDEIEAALLNEDARRNLLKKKSNAEEHALWSLKSYLEEAWAIMGPPFLESAAKAMMSKQGSSIESEQADVGVNDGGGVELGAQMVNQAAVQAQRDHQELNKVGERVASSLDSGQDLQGDDSVSDRVELAAKAINQEQVQGSGSKQVGEADGEMVKSHRKKHTARRGTRRAMIVDTDDSGSDVSCTRNDPLPSPEVRKVQEALKTSIAELQAMVKDPLPDALKVSEIVRSELQRKQMNEIENQNRPIQDTERTDELVQADEANMMNQKNAARSSLLERNSTARTFEWDHSIDDTAEGTSKSAPKISKRRTPRRWSVLEEAILRTGVRLYGKGNWKFILTKYSHVFEGRTECDLKDKWRNLTRAGQIR